MPPRYFRAGPGRRGKSFLPAAILRNGRDLVATGWTSGADARTLKGQAVHPWSVDATSWSVLGALVCGDEARQGRVPIDRIATAVVLLASTLGTASLVGWNEEPGRTQADAVAAFDAAIASAAERPESLVRRSSA
jgi:hypothetical protein